MALSPQTLSIDDRRIAGSWAADCAGRVLAIFEDASPDDPRVRTAIDQTRAFAAGELDVGEAVRRRGGDAGARRGTRRRRLRERRRTQPSRLLPLRTCRPATNGVAYTDRSADVAAKQLHFVYVHSRRPARPANGGTLRHRRMPVRFAPTIGDSRWAVITPDAATPI